VDAVSAEDIGQFPDASIGEALSRIPGVTVNRGAINSMAGAGAGTATGNPTGITVRGFGTQFNEILSEGRQVASGNGQTFDFSALGAEYVGELDIHKTPDYSLSAGAVGATINIKSPKPFDKPGMQARAFVSTNDNQKVLNIFYFCNYMHDFFYMLGFDEEAGNFQRNNFGRGGAGNDGIFAETQDGSGTDNSNFGTPNDGSNPRMQMYIFTDANFRRSDGSLDMDVVAHEHYHGVSNRSVGKGTADCLGLGLDGEPSGQGEGWSDYNAISLTDDDTVGEYVTGDFQRAIRRLPYTNYRWSYGAVNGTNLNRRDQGTAALSDGGFGE